MSIKKAINTYIWAIYAGLCIGVGVSVYLNMENKIVGSFLFSVGLLSILIFGMNLFTGKVGYIVRNKPVYCLEVIITWFGNFTGTFIAATVLKMTRNSQHLIEVCTPIAEAKLVDSLSSLFILGIFCGMLMFIAVECYKRCQAEKKEFMGSLMAIFIVVVFIQCGFEHCIADMFYFALSGRLMEALPALLVITLGNMVGGNLINIGQLLMEKIEG